MTAATLRKPRKREAPRPPGLEVWFLHARPLGSKGEFQIYPSAAHPYRFVRLADGEATIRRMQDGSGGGTRRYEVMPVHTFLPHVKALAEVYCELCNVQTGNYQTDRPERRLTSSCKDCAYR